MNALNPPQTPQDGSTGQISQVWQTGNVYMSPYPSQPTTPFNPSAIPSLTHVHSNFAPNYTSFSPTYYPAETPMPAHKKRRVDDDLLPSFTSPASGSTADNQLHIKALAAEIEQLQKKLEKLTKERETFGYKKRAPRLDVRQKLDAIFKCLLDELLSEDVEGPSSGLVSSMSNK